MRSTLVERVGLRWMLTVEQGFGNNPLEMVAWLRGWVNCVRQILMSVEAFKGSSSFRYDADHVVSILWMGRVAVGAWQRIARDPVQPDRAHPENYQMNLKPSEKRKELKWKRKFPLTKKPVG